MKNRSNRNEFGHNFVAIWFLGSILILVLLFFLFFIYGIYDCYTYTQISDKGVTVEAIVTSYYKSTDPEDGTEYHSYITYTYEGKEYKKLYQTKYSESNLTPIGETVYLEIHPHDPEYTPDGIKFTGQLGMGLLGSLFIAGHAVILKFVYSSRAKKQTVDCVNEETFDSAINSIDTLKIAVPDYAMLDFASDIIINAKETYSLASDLFANLKINIDSSREIKSIAEISEEAFGRYWSNLC